MPDVTPKHDNGGLNQVMRDSRGRFLKGYSGNPRGKLPGTLHKTTRLAKALLEGEAENLVRKCIELALAGDVTALRLCLERLIPKVEVRESRTAYDAFVEALEIEIRKEDYLPRNEVQEEISPD